jgi:hypothetical protein
VVDSLLTAQTIHLFGYYDESFYAGVAVF